jgi:hypothetical protein
MDVFTIERFSIRALLTTLIRNDKKYKKINKK